MNPVSSPQPCRLDECGDVLTARQVCGVLQISDREYRRRRQHGAWAIPSVPGFTHRYTKVAVQRFLESSSCKTRLRRVG